LRSDDVAAHRAKMKLNISIFENDAERSSGLKISYLKKKRFIQDKQWISSQIKNNLKNIAVWANCISNLTRGYYPGDLVAVIQKSYSMHLGNQQIHYDLDSDITSTKVSVTDLQWKTMLDAIATVPLKSLQSLDIINSQDMIAEKVSWESFAGYSETIYNIKRILRPLLKTSKSSSLALSVDSRQQLSLRYHLPRGMVLYGPSGCGKTLLAKVIAREVWKF